MSLLHPRIKTNTYAQNKRRRYHNRSRVGSPAKNSPIPGNRTDAQLFRKLRSQASRKRRKELEEIKRQRGEAIYAKLKD